MSYAEFPDRRTIELTVQGALCRADYDRIMGPMSQFIARFDEVQVIEIVDSFSGFEDEIVTQADPDNPGPLAHIKRVALVSDIGWFCPILSAAPSTLGIRIKSFKRNELDEARRWVVFAQD